MSQTWWGLLINALEAKLCVNCAYSGARVANKDGETYLGQHIFDLSRDAGVAYLELDGSTTTPEAAVFPDIVIIFAGINDATNNTEITDARSDTLQGSEFTTDFTNSFRKTLWETNKYIKKDGGKNADIYCVLLPQFSMWGTTNTLNYNMVDYNKAIKDCCDLWGFPYLDLSKIATFPEVEDDISLGDQTHPNAKGMKIIASFMKREMMRYPPQRSSINEIII